MLGAMNGFIQSRLAATCVLAAMVAPGAPRAASLGNLFPAETASCFVATFDNSHLARNPKQTVVTVRIATVPEHVSVKAPLEMVILDLDLSLRGRKKPFTAVGLTCHRGDGDVWSCHERRCNPRYIEVTAHSPDALTLDLRQRDGGRLKAGGLTLKSECGAAEVEKVSKLALGAADQVFRLKRAPASACR
jgi:hypothetical protein